MLIGYARVSTSDQDTTLQHDALRRAGVRHVFEEKRSGGSTTRRLELQRMLGQLRPGDVVTVYKLDRLARSLRDLLGILDTIEAAGAHFRSLTESIDTGTAAGRMMMQMVGAFAEFERGVIRERSMAGLEVAKANGVRLGRLPALDARAAAKLARQWATGRYSKTELASMYAVSVSTIKRTLWRRGLDSITEAHAHGMLPPTP